MKLDELPKDRLKALRWGSHVPVCEAVFDAFGIDSVLELGAGLNSTPLFFARAGHVVSIEADADWISRMRSEGVTEDATRTFVHYRAPKGVNRSTYREKLPPGELEHATRFYVSQIPPTIGLLFIDCYAGYRRQAILDLYRRSRVVVWHDAEPEHDHQYGYSSMRFDDGWQRIVDRTWPAHTGVLLCPDLAHQSGRFVSLLRHSAARYAERFGVERDLRFEVA